MNKINIYINEQEKMKLKQTSQKYKVSYSTITDKVCYWFFYVLVHHAKDPKYLDQIKNEYIDKSKGRTKTSVKPQCLFKVLDNEIKNKSIFATNALIIYCNKSINIYVDEKGVNKFYNKIDKDLTTTKDQFYNYNNIVRNTARAVKNNKEYYRKLLEQ